MRYSDVVRQVDGWMLLVVAALVSFGLVAIYSVGLSQPGLESLALKKQLTALAIGSTLAVLFMCTNYRLFDSFTPHIYIGSVLLLVGVLLFGETIRGTQGWFRFGGFSFQPVEFSKLGVLLVLARYFSRRRYPWLSWRDVIMSGALVGVPVLLVLAQPDLGSALVLVAIWGVLLCFSGLSYKQAGVLFLLGVVVSVFAWNVVLAPYQKDRLTSFLSPESDALGIGYNIVQSKIAVGSGGLFGRGLGFGSQSQLRFLPEAHTDFVIAVISEELGFFGFSMVLLAFGLLFWRLIRLVQRSGDGFTMLLLLGGGAILWFQLVVNIGMNIGLLPVTGITLPFISYGGSSLVFFLMLFGLFESVAVHQSVFHIPDRLFSSMTS